ncbi:MAG: ATP-binding cassette domain-containing protein, partial [Polyangiaceae bacterium]
NAAEWGAKRGERSASTLETRLEQVRARERPTLQREHGRALEFTLPATRRSHIVTLDESEIRAGERVLLRDVRITLQRGERVAICGANGAGKSTLLACMLRALNVPSERVLYLAQDLPESEAMRYAEQVHALPRNERGRVCELLSALGAAPDAVLASRCPSPGEARKLVLAFGLCREVEALFLDEPTNHLDLPAIERLEEALLRYPGALVAVSHDQRFLERTTEQKLQIAAGQLVWR